MHRKHKVASKNPKAVAAAAKTKKVTYVYSKIAEPYPKTLHRLWNKGLIIDNRGDAEHALKPSVTTGC